MLPLWVSQLVLQYYFEGKVLDGILPSFLFFFSSKSFQVFCKAHNAMTGSSNTAHASGHFNTNVELNAAAKSQAIASDPARGKPLV
jgi:hypothetical protein